MADLSPRDGCEGVRISFMSPLYKVEVIKSFPEASEDPDQAGASFIELVASSAQLVVAIKTFCDLKKTRNPYPTASVLGEHLKTSRALLDRYGWELLSRPGVEPWFKVVRGARFWKFQKELVA
jgi:hypothetical protein